MTQRTTKQITKRNIVTFEPSGPVRSMLANELRNKPHGAQKKLMEEALVCLLRNKYPKLADRFDILREEGVL